MSFATTMGRNVDKNISKNLSSKYSQKLLDQAKQPAIDALTTSSKGVIQKTVEATGALTGNKIADKIISVSKTSPQVIFEANEEILRERYISPELKQKIIDDLRLKKD